MSDTKQTGRLIPTPGKMLITLLETLPAALFVVDDSMTIMYTNASAQAMTGATREELFGKSLWCCAPQLVSTSLYQAIQRARQTREPAEVEYVSSVTNIWLHVSLSPTDEGLALFFHENPESPHLQETFNRNEQMYQDLLESFSDGVTILTPDGLVLDINQRPLTDAHIRREEVIGKPFIDLPAWSYDSAVQQQLRAAITRASLGENVCFEARIRPRADMYLDILMTITSHRDANQQVEYLICAGRDITERKQAEDELRTLVDAIPHFVWMMRPDGSAEYGNQRWCDYTNMTPEQLQGDGWLTCLHPDDRRHVLDAWQTAVRTETPYEVEHRIQHGGTGEYRWFLARGLPLKDRRGAIKRWFGTCTDIDEQKRAEQRLQASEENLRTLAETVPQLVWTTLPDGSVAYWNQRWYDYIGSSPRESLGHKWSQFLHPDDYQQTLTAWHHALETGGPYEIEYRLKDGKMGGYRWFLARGMPVYDEAGQILKWFGTCTDIEEQKRIEEALRQSQERVNILMNSSIIGIFVAEGEQIIEANDTYLRMTGYTREDLQAGSINWVRMTPPEYAIPTQKARQELMVSHHVTRYEKEYICKDGSRLPVVVGGVVLRLETLQVIGFVLDNSARKELEQRKDDFISMASHELKTPLTSLKLQTQLVRTRLTRQGLHETAADLAKVEKPVKQLERLIGELLDVSKIQAGKLDYVQETVDLNVLLREVADIMQQISTTHRVVVRGTTSHLLIGDQGRLEQVFANLISNAIKYSPDAESVEIDLSTVEEANVICVHDYGLGIPREQRDKIFERFYRAADSKQRAIPGLGMGLYITAEIVKRHGGTITVDSTVGKGTTFTVTLPIKKDA